MTIRGRNLKLAIAIAFSLVAACVDQGDPSDSAVGSSAEQLNCGQGGGAPGVAPPQSRPHGHTYAEWARSWEQWLVRIPAASSPLADETGASCRSGQAGSVWYLAGNYGGATTRDCTIPTGTALFFPLINYLYVGYDSDPPDQDYAALSQIVASYIDGAQVTAEIDGRPVAVSDAYRVTSANGPMLLPVDNMFGATAAECHAGPGGLLHCPFGVNNGYYLFVEPLAAGLHTIHFTGGVPGFALDVTYHLRVGR